MKIEFLPPARAELMDAVSYYNTQSEGLGYEFAAEGKRRSNESSSTLTLGPGCQNVPAVAGPTDSLTGLSTRSGKRPCLLLRSCTWAESQKDGNYDSEPKSYEPRHNHCINLMRISRVRFWTLGIARAG